MPRAVRYRFFSLVAVVMPLLLLAPAVAASAATRGGLVDPMVAQRFGLERAWFSQVQLDSTRHRVEHVVLHDGQLFALTTAGVLHVMDAETGRTVWIQRFGNPDYPSLGPAVSKDHVALINGSTLYVMERDTGREVLSRAIGGGPAGGPALTESMAFVPLFNGKIEGYRIAEPLTPALYFASAGRIFTSPLTTADSVVWPTDAGILYVANSSGRGVRFRFESTSPLAGHPAARNGLLYTSSATGYVFALNEQNGNQVWRYASGAPTSRSPVVLGGRVFLATNLPSLHCINAATGQLLWEAPNIRQVVAISKTRAYGINKVGNITILDAATGVRHGLLHSDGTTTAVLNNQTDRLYLVSESGLLQCLREEGAQEPLVHGDELDESLQRRKAKPPAGEEDNPFGDPAEEGDPFAEPMAPEEDPFGGAPAEPEGDPFGSDAPPPAEEPPAEEPGDNPFDFG